MTPNELASRLLESFKELTDADTAFAEAQRLSNELREKAIVTQKEHERLFEELRKQLGWPDVIEYEGKCYILASTGHHNYKRLREVKKGVISAE